MRMLNCRGMAVLGVAVGISMMGWQSANAITVIDENFDSDTSGLLPSGALFGQHHNLPPDGRIEVTGVGVGELTDPFGGAGNKSMGIVDNSSGLVPAVSFIGTQADFPAPGLVQGKLSFNLFLDRDANDPNLDNAFLDIRIGSGEFNGGLVNNDPAIWVMMGHATGNANANITILQGANGGTIGLDNIAGLTQNTNHLVEIEFFSNQTYTLSIDGTLASSLGNTTFNWANFGFGTASELHIMNFQSDGGADGSRVFIDNLKLEGQVPEPASIAMLAFGGLAMMKRHRAC